MRKMNFKTASKRFDDFHDSDFVRSVPRMSIHEEGYTLLIRNYSATLK
jgi:hypothetical protein